ncbi:MAG: hypothetical protein PHR16_14920 [Methylovulum sp.]|nr:hypothetical protein [Methylovulum sp.]
MQDPIALRKNLHDRLVETVESRNALLQHAAFLTTMGVHVQPLRVYALSSMDEVTRNFIDGLCKRLTAHHANGTPAKIELDRGLYQVADHKRLTRQTRELFGQCDDGQKPEEEMALISVYLDALDFAAIATEIDRQAANLVNTGLGLMANAIIDQLSLRHFRRGFSGVRYNRVIFETYAFSDNGIGSKLQELESLRPALNLIETEAGLPFGGAMDAYIAEARRLNYSYPKIASRTVFGKGGGLEIHCFKDKHEFRFTRTALDAVLAFLMLHGGEEIAAHLLDSLNPAEAA